MENNLHVRLNNGQQHHTHNHVMVYTHYFDKPIDHKKFEKLFGQVDRAIRELEG